MSEPADHQAASRKRARFFDYLLDRADPVKVLHFLLRPSTRWAICWFVVLALASFITVQAWRAFDSIPSPDGTEAKADGKDGTEARRDGNAGHTTIDFGGQWLMGRMIVEGQGRHLYHRHALRHVLEDAYPPGDQSPSAEKSDVEALMDWLSGDDDKEAPKVIASFLGPLAATNNYDALGVLASSEATWTPENLAHATEPSIGGALYPPIHALNYAPVALFPPPVAYRVVQIFILALGFFAGWVVHQMTQGRVWWPVACFFVFLFPSFSGCISLGQNGMISLTILLVGWWQLMRGREVLAGCIWGLLAFKPVWAVAFLLVPVMTGRWRMAASMSGMGLGQILLTLPIVGWESWMNWMHVGRLAAYDYLRQENWIFLSRDLLGIPRRWLLQFDGGIARRLIWQSETTPGAEEHWFLALLGWGLWTAVLLSTLGVLYRCGQRRKELTGPLPAFVLLGAMFSCYHFMYYDVLLAGLPVLLLFTEPRRYFQVVFWRWRNKSVQTLPKPMQLYYKPTWDHLSPPPMPLLPEGRRPRWVTAALPPLVLTILVTVPSLSVIFDPSYHFPPNDTFALLLLWAWCGYRVLHPSRDRQEAVDVSRLPGGRGSETLPIPSAQLAELGADVGRAHERLADQDSADAGRL